ncbi:hypothetical protein [Okeania sp. SIO2C2]|uniref:hypothetical protein n=1 Tax=Okeania sp. SIO2C2 TaxID=2607787 RepID=UPI00257CDD2B|nr:hypothetical protein [Okeania sp. SIO2C2]
MPDNRMEKLMVPAILVYNNQVFRDQDFESIKSLGQSKKSQDLQKTGRFGVGFNAIYHVTDFPSFISRQSLIFFDPHGAAIPGTSRQEPGREWSIAAEKWYEKYPDFMKVYEVGGLLFGNAIYDYLYKNFVDNRNVTNQEKLKIQKRFNHRPCLSDESSSKFWQPKNTFQVKVPFFLPLVVFVSLLPTL